ncbi:beta-ketoacyl-[acyl-carrier-protein] synthase family protein [Streptomyces sp. NPDC051940]|uniref:beta-ketoacyl-[acyl-carrier-protein] synthase family protein n=1 Tax=Streptomyces sp. NPDC051940 TaxID=3155675 RepID=UPI003431C46C
MVRVVVTGIGVRCAGADGTEQFWKRLTAGESAVDTVHGLDLGSAPCRIGGQVADLPYSGVGDERDRVAQLLFAALREAVADAGADLPSYDPSRVGISLGQCQAGFYDDGYAQFLYASADHVAAELGVTGPRTVVSTACTAGAAALGQAAERLLAGETDLMIAGGVDQLFAPTWHGFTSLQALSPDGCRAYSESDGLVLGEGAGILVLEPWERAKARGATVYAELKGWGSSGDAYHITAPDPSGKGAVLAMTRALHRAGFVADDVDYVCGHGTGTPPNDRMETKAHRLMFGERAPGVPLTSIKPVTGHTLGATGAIEAAATVLALREQTLFPTAGFPEGAEPALDHVPNTARTGRLDVAVSNNFAFGGDNSSLVFCRPGLGPEPVSRWTDDVVITGVGAVGPIGSGYAEWRDALLAGRHGLGPARGFDAAGLPAAHVGELPALDPRGVASLGDWRQMDTLGRLALTVARQAWTDAGLRLTAAERTGTAVILATATGPLGAIAKFTDSIRAGEPSPVLFPNTVFTSASGHVCKAMRLRGPRSTFSSGSVAAVHAVEYARTLVARGDVEHAIVIGAEELTRLHLSTPGPQQRYMADERALPFQRGSAGINLGSAGVAFILERAGSAARRGARRYGAVLGSAVGGDALPKDARRKELDPRGTQWEAVLHRAVGRAGLTPDDIGYVSAVASGALMLDSLETGVLSRVFGPRIPVSATKAAVGETQGASGAVALLAALVALDTGRIPPTAGLTDPVGAGRVAHVAHGTTAELGRDAVMANAFSIGGTYGSLVVGR